MSYKLNKPFTKKQRDDFITEYAQNCNNNRDYTMTIEETATALYALEPNEIMQDGEVVINPNYEQEQAQKERERLNNLTMTKRVLWLQSKELGISYQQLKDLIATNEDAQAEWDLCENLKRDNPLLDIMGAKLNITPEQIDNMFKIANGEEPLKEEPKEPITEDAKNEN